MNFSQNKIYKSSSNFNNKSKSINKAKPIQKPHENISIKNSKNTQISNISNNKDTQI